MRGLQLVADGLAAPLDGLLLALAADDERAALRDLHACGAAEHALLGIGQRQAALGGDDLAAGEDGHVLQLGLAALLGAGAHDGCADERALLAIHEQGVQGLAAHVIGHDEQRMAGLHDLLQHGHDVLEVVCQALVGNQDVGLLQLAGHGTHVVGHVRGDEAAVEQHALLDLQADAELGGLLNGDDAVLADLIQGLGDLRADLGVARGDGGDLGHLLARGHLRGGLQQLVGCDVGGLLDAATQRQRIVAGGNVAHALAHDGVGEQRCRGSAVAGLVVRGGRSLADHLQAHLLHMVVCAHVRGNGSAVVGNVGMALALLGDADVAALRADGHAHRVGQLRHTGRKLLARLVVVCDFLSHAMSPFLEHVHNDIC